MTDRQNIQQLEQSVAEVAAEWAIKLGDEDLAAEELNAFRRWLAESSGHWQAYHDARAAVDEIDRLGRRFYTGVAGIADGSVNMAPARPRSRRRRWQVPAALAAAASLLVAVFGYREFNALFAEETIYATETGQQRVIQLADNSKVRLNTRTKIAVEYLPGARRVTLLEGEALFDVAPDEQRPFTVFVRDAEVRAVGTQFNVYKRRDDTTVAVLEGLVKVSFVDRESLWQTPQALHLEAGSQALVDSRQHTLQKSVVDINAAVAWLTGKLVFNKMPLSKVVEEFNRYNESRLVISDFALEDHEITGTFDPYDVEAFIKTLHLIMKVRAIKVTNYATLLLREA